MRPQIFIAALSICLMSPPVFAAGTQQAQYAGQQTRAIKALPDEDIAALRNGEGMGMAKAAELNAYPGPSHVRALSRELTLTADQARRAGLIFDRMNTAAKTIGEALIAQERALDQTFAGGHATSARVARQTAAIGDLQGRLRAVHLAAHLETRVLLTLEQIALYQRLRGYGDAGGTAPHHHHG